MSAAGGSATDIPVTLVGCGMIGHEHVRAISECGGFRLATICDPRPANLRSVIEAARGHAEGVTQFGDWSEAIEAADGGGVVVVALPPYLHHAPVAAALERDLDVLCEKPLARTVQEGALIQETVERKGLLLHECSSRYLGPVVGEFHHAIRSGELGQLFNVELVARKQRARPGIDDGLSPSWRLDKRYTGGGSLWGHGAYDLTMLMRFLPVPREIVVSGAYSVQAETNFQPPPQADYNVETTSGAALSFVYDDSSPIAVCWERTSYSHGSQETYVRLRGTKATWTWDWIADPCSIKVETEGNSTVHTQTQTIPGRTNEPNMQPFRFFAEALIARRAGHEIPTPAVRVEEAVFHLRVMDAVYQCAQDGASRNVACPPGIAPSPILS